MSEKAPRRPRALVTQERTLHTHAELWHASRSVLGVGRRNRVGSAWQFLSSIILTAFAMEAYLNHAGRILLPKVWDEYERLSPMGKLYLLASHVGVSYPGGKSARPLSTILKLFKFRNQIAHGKTKILRSEPKEVDVDKVFEYFRDQPRDEWEYLIRSESFAVRVREDVEAALVPIHEKLPEPRGSIFDPGLGSGSANAI